MRRSSAFFTALVTATLPTLLTPMAPAHAAPPLEDRLAGQSTAGTAVSPASAGPVHAGSPVSVSVTPTATASPDGYGTGAGAASPTSAPGGGASPSTAAPSTGTPSTGTPSTAAPSTGTPSTATTSAPNAQDTRGNAGYDNLPTAPQSVLNGGRPADDASGGAAATASGRPAGDATGSTAAGPSGGPAEGASGGAAAGPSGGPAGGVSGRAANPIDLVGLDFQLINAASRWCLTSSMTELPCATSDPYRWRFRPVTVTGEFEILNVRTNTCLTMPGGTTTDGARADLASCGPVPSRRWQLRDSLGETAKVVNTRTGKCLQIQSGVAVQDSCAGTHGTRRWTVRVIGMPIPGLGVRQR